MVAAITGGLGLVFSAAAISQTQPPKSNVDKLVDDMLNDIQKRKPSTAPTASRASGPIDIPAVRDKIRPCWNSAVGKNPPIVSITVRMDKDARPLQAFVRDKNAYDSNVDYRTAADAALRAIMNPRCHPWPLPLDKYEVWQTITFNFDSRNF